MAGVIDYSSGFLIMAGIYAVFSLGLNIQWGHTGLFNIGIAAFFALGAYTAALLASEPPSAAQYEDFVFAGDLARVLGQDSIGVDLWFPIVLAAAAVVCALVALMVGTLTLRLRDDYLAITTLGLGETVRLVFLNQKAIGNGSKGLYGIPKVLDNVVSPADYDWLYFVVVLVVLVVLYLAAQRAASSPWGRVLRAVRDNETTAAAVGKNVFWFKLQAFAFGAAIMGIGGALFAHGIRFIDPLTFDPLLATFIIWAMLMVGGSGNHLGAILGAFVVWGVWTGTQFLGNLVPDSMGFLDNAANDPDLRFFMIGFLIVAVLLLRPAGILPERRART
ncbi:MAG: branched-chain amino acid ABC transporter permease [Dehalococcoidia bacterium]